MKYQLTQLVQSLSREEVRNFKLLTSKYKTKGISGIVLLFDILRKKEMDEYDDEIVSLVLPGSTKNNYYRLKNRLIEEVENSLVELHRKKDESFEIFRLLRLARIFIYKSNYQKSQQYLREAEKIALKLENYAAMHLIYEQLMKLSHNTTNTDPIHDVHRKRKYNDIHRKIEENKFLLATVNYKMRTTNFAGKDKNIHLTLDNVLEQLQVMEELKDSVTVKLEIHRCVRDSLLQRKEFSLLADYMIDSFEGFSTHKVFSKNTHHEKIVILIWIINSTLKTKEYEQTIHYLNLLRKAMQEYNGLYYKQYFWVYHLSQLTIKGYLRQNKEAIQLMEEALKKNRLDFNNPYAMYVYANLSAVYYCDDNMDKAQHYLSLIISDASFSQQSPLWKINLKIIEIIYHVEQESFVYAKSIYDNIRRAHRGLLKDEAYLREFRFMDILRDVIQTPKAFKNSKIIHKINGFLEAYPNFEPGANEAINYNIWLTSRMKQSAYYEELLAQ